MLENNHSLLSLQRAAGSQPHVHQLNIWLQLVSGILATPCGWYIMNDALRWSFMNSCANSKGTAGVSLRFSIFWGARYRISARATEGCIPWIHIFKRVARRVVFIKYRM